MVVRVPDINGISKQKSKFTNIKTKGANQRETRANKIKADRMLAQWLETLSLAESYGGDQDFITAIEEWLAEKKRTIRPDSYESYQCNYYKHIKPYFEPKKLRLEEITPRIIQRYVREKEESGQSRKSIRKHLVILKVKRTLLLYWTNCWLKRAPDNLGGCFGGCSIFGLYVRGSLDPKNSQKHPKSHDFGCFSCLSTPNTELP